MRGFTVWRYVRSWLAATGVLGALLLTAGCHVTQSAAAVPAASPAASGAATASGGPAGVGASAAAAGPVVALGDSYTAGALVPFDPAVKPAGCLRSVKAYPVLVAKALGASLTDAACASAGVKNMTAPQRTYLGTNPAQLSVLAPDDSLVLLSLSGDDMGFLNVLQECVKLSFTDPRGSPCAAHYGRQAATEKSEAAKMTQVLSAIRDRAPRARIVLVGYPDLFPRSGGCWPRVPITPGDIAYLRDGELALNAMLAADAARAGATYVDTYTPTLGHDFCQPESVRDVEGLIPGSLTLPFHPNTRGQAAIAAAVLSAIKT